MARGVKRKTSKNMWASSLFTYGEYLLYKGKNMYSLNEAFLIESFSSLSKDIETLTYASYLCELTDMALADNEKNEGLFKFLISAFFLMKSGGIDIENLARAFEINLLKHTGYELQLDRCSVCGSKIRTSNFFNMDNWGSLRKLQ